MLIEQKCILYMDNIVFLRKTKAELERNTLEGIKILDKHELYVKESKCYWEVEEVPILGHIIGNNMTRMEPSKTKVIKGWQMLKNKKDIQKFNRFCNLYQ